MDYIKKGMKFIAGLIIAIFVIIIVIAIARIIGRELALMYLDFVK
jgi:hypothetical protein